MWFAELVRKFTDFKHLPLFFGSLIRSALTAGPLHVAYTEEEVDFAAKDLSLSPISAQLPSWGRIAGRPGQLPRAGSAGAIRTRFKPLALLRYF